MSTGNKIIILESPVSKDSEQAEYRVAHCQASENLEDQPDNQGFNTKVVSTYFENSPVYQHYQLALIAAIEMDAEVGYVGIPLIKLPFPFPKSTVMFENSEEMVAMAVYGYIRADYPWIPLEVKHPVFGKWVVTAFGCDENRLKDIKKEINDWLEIRMNYVKNSFISEQDQAILKALTIPPGWYPEGDRWAKYVGDIRAFVSFFNNREWIYDINGPQIHNGGYTKVSGGFMCKAMHDADKEIEKILNDKTKD